MAAKKKVKATQCPNGHELPREGCSPVYCGNVTALVKAKKEKPAPREADDDEAEERLSYALSRERVRDRALPIPSVQGAEAEEYVEKKKVELLPRAMQEVEFQLRYGDDKQRVEAARDVLRMNGMLNRDAPTGVAPTIIINMKDGNASFPWLKRKENSDAQVVAAAPAGREEG